MLNIKKKLAGPVYYFESNETIVQRTYIPRVPQCLRPRPNWDPPPALSQANVSPPPKQKEGTHSPADERVGGPNSNDWKKSLAFCFLL
jgi:hypothetical protein